jgi:hypothetical protein
MAAPAFGQSVEEQVPHEEAIKTFERAFVGRWGPRDAAEGMSVTLTKDRSTFIIQSEFATRFAGWDPENRCIKVNTYSSDGSYSFSLWRLADAKPTYRIEILEISPDGSKVTSKATVIFPDRDHWRFTLEGGQPMDFYRIKK